MNKDLKNWLDEKEDDINHAFDNSFKDIGELDIYEKMVIGGGVLVFLGIILTCLYIVLFS